MNRLLQKMNLLEKDVKSDAWKHTIDLLMNYEQKRRLSSGKEPIGQ